MHTLPETFLHCKTTQSFERCPECNAILYHKKLDISKTEFRSLKNIGITHKAVKFCSNPGCDYIVQGIIYKRASEENFVDLIEIDGVIRNIVDNFVDKK